MTAPYIRLGAGELAVTFAPARGEGPALLLFHRPGPGEDTTPRRVDLSGDPDDQRRLDWNESLTRAYLVLAADPVRGFDGLLECVAESAAVAAGRQRAPASEVLFLWHAWQIECARAEQWESCEEYDRLHARRAATNARSRAQQIRELLVERGFPIPDSSGLALFMRRGGGLEALLGVAP